MTERTRRNAPHNTQPREADILISLTAVQKSRLRFLAKTFGVSMTEVVRLLVDEQYVKRVLSDDAKLIENSPVSAES